MPAHLAQLYDGALAIRDGTVYANFVSSIDGVAALEGGTAASGGIISGRNESDRFVMGLLRAFADAVLVGAGTVRAEGRRAMWTPEFVFPGATGAFAALRRALKRQKAPQLVIASARGELDPSSRVLEEGALVLTTSAVAPRLRKTLPSTTEVRALSDGEHLGVDEILDSLEADGHQTILTEGGPQLFGELVAHNRVDELFLTVSPRLGGQPAGSFGIIRGVDFGRSLKRGRLLSLRRADSYLFLRYAMEHAG